MTPNTLMSIGMFVVLASFITQRKHLLMTLLCLEALILMLVSILIFNWSDAPQMMTPMFIILLTLGACEASLGLALLVSMTRTTGSDMIYLLTLNKC